MQVNREWWSGTAREFYIDGTVGETPIITTCPNLETSVRANLSKYQGVEWDKSICPWKINFNSDFFKFQWALPYYQIGVSGTTMAQSPLFKERKKGYTFYISAAGGSSSHMPHEIVNSHACTKPLWKTCLSNDELDLSNTDIDYWFDLKYRHIFPVINFDYSRIFVAPMIHTESGSGWVFHDDARIRAVWDSTAVYGISLMFYGKSNIGGSYPICAGLFSLNNKFAQPQWDTTNCWKDDIMFDNALAVAWSDAWVGGYEVGGIQTVGSNTLWGTDPNNPGFADQTFANENAAGAVMYFPMKNIMIQTPADTEDTIWSTEWDHFYLGGGYNQGTKRHLKSGITYDEFADYLKQQLAYLGFRFCIDANHFSDSIDSQYYYIPEIDSKGVTTGNYVAANAPEAENYINYTWTDDVYESTPYDGTDDDDDEGDPNEYDENNETELNALAAQAKNYFFNTYCLSPTQLRQLSEYMYTEMPTNQSTEDFLTNNPIDVIINLQMFPFTIAAGVTPDILMLGKLKPRYWDATASEWKDILVYNVPSQVIILDCGSCTYYPEYGVHDFRNYEPYCTAELELPYCGNIKIPTSVYLNHTIKVKYIVDLITGACLALVYRDDLAYLAVTGQIGTQFPVSAVQSADLQASIMRKQTQYGESLINVARSTIGGALSVQGAANAAPAPGASTALGAYTGLLSAFNQLEQAEFNVEHIQVPFTMHGSSSPMTSFANEQYPRLILKRPVMLPDYNAENYGHIVGFACNITAPLSAFSGLTVCSTANLDGVAATEAEKQLLRRALLDGIIL